MFDPLLVWELTRKDYRERYAGSVLGIIWALIWPLVPIFIYTIIFGKFMGARLPGTSNIYSYSIYVSVGLIPWNTFSNCISRSTSAFVSHKHIISKVPTSLPALIMFIHLSETITLIITVAFFTIFLLLTGYEFTQHLILFPFILYSQYISTIGAGLIAATLTVFIRDLKEIIDILLQIWFWFTPLVYIPDILPQFVKNVMCFNPTFILTNAYHSIFVYHEFPDFRTLIIYSTFSHLLVYISYLLFRKLEKDVRDFL